jgi:multiple sugar transport system substrate-binding protein
MHDRLGGKLRSSGHLSRRDLLRRSAAVGVGAAALPLLSRLPAAAQEIPRQKSSATVSDRLRVLLKNDFHPDHNAFMRAELEAYAALNGWTIEITDVAGYQGGGDLNQKLLGAVRAGDVPDVLIHDVGALNMHTLGLLEPVTDLMAEVIQAQGDPIPGARFDSAVGEEWFAIPFFTRSNGLFVRQDIFAEHGLDVIEDTDTFDKLRTSALAVSDPAQNMWGWGMTVNRSGDGASLVQEVMYRFGGHLQDETGQIVTFNSPETVAAFEWLKATYSDEQWAPMLPPGVLSWTDTNNNEAYLANQIAITRNAGTVYAKAVLDKVPFADQIAMIPSPKRNSDGARLDFFSGGMKFFVVKGAKNREAVYDLARHFLTQPVLERVWSISTGYALPAYANGWDNPIIEDNPNSVRGREMALTETGFNGLPWPGEDNEAVASIGSGVYFTDMISEILQGRPVEEAVADYHDQFVQIYQDFGREGE